MTKTLASLALMLILLSGAAFGSLTSQAKPTELEGTWVATTLEREGKTLPEQALGGMRFTFTGDTVVMHNYPRPGTEECRFTVSTAGANKAIDYTRPNGTVVRGLYSMSGKTLKLAMPRANSPDRPSAIAAEPGSGTLVLTLKPAGE